MNEFPFQLSEIKLALKRQKLNYKLLHSDSDDGSSESLTFLDVREGRRVRGKVIRTFNEGEVYHWPVISHENIAPLLDVLNMREDLNIFLTTDLQIKLKSIIHDEDFLYDSKCLERKRRYAKGIFSGLSYLHAKSLCLMNLSDENIFICKKSDRAIITNLSSLICSRKNSRSKLKVCELYRAPETENREFDVIAAEIWASGTLMLDMFLTHMFPWAVIDHKPRRILEMVDKLSLEFFQAANAGSLLTSVDLAKFKAFLRCFFRENPNLRITAKYAAIASFLRPNFYDNNTQFGPSGSNNKSIQRRQFGSYDLSSRSVPFSQRAYTKSSAPAAIDFKRQLLPVGENFESKLNDALGGSEIPKWVTPKYAITSAVCLKGDQRSKTESSIDVCNSISSNHHYNSVNIDGKKKEISSDAEYKQDESDTESVRDFCKNNIHETSTEIAKSHQAIKDNAETVTTSNFACYQSKSLTLIKPIIDEVSREISFQVCSSRTCSYSNIKSLKHLSESTLQKSDLGLTLLFGDEEKKNVESHNEKKEFSPVVSGGVKIKSSEGTSDFKKCVPMTRDNGVDYRVSCDYMDFHDIIETIILLKKCHVSLENHLMLFSNREFVTRQRDVVNEYLLLLHQEKIRLYEILRNKYALNVDEIIKIIRPVNERCRYLRDYSRTPNTRKKRNSSPEISRRVLEEKLDNPKTALTSSVNYPRYKIVKPSVVPSWRPERNYSYCRAVSKSRTDREKGGGIEKTVAVKANKSKETVLDKDTSWNDRAATTVTEDEKSKTFCSRYGFSKQLQKEKDEDQNPPYPHWMKMRERHMKKEKAMMHQAYEKKKSKERKSKDHKKTEVSKRSFFMSFCPRGKLSESASVLDDLCERCKLNRKIT